MDSVLGEFIAHLKQVDQFNARTAPRQEIESIATRQDTLPNEIRGLLRGLNMFLDKADTNAGKTEARQKAAPGRYSIILHK